MGYDVCGKSNPTIVVDIDDPCLELLRAGSLTFRYEEQYPVFNVVARSFLYSIENDKPPRLS
ncbi:MAG: hypothetical protein JSV21_10005 [Nitrospirota bacterium]|nr:MAG: hypothetical protein JSV21_10005 [Nitrospirota bacterium]